MADTLFLDEFDGSGDLSDHTPDTSVVVGGVWDSVGTGKGVLTGTGEVSSTWAGDGSDIAQYPLISGGEPVIDSVPSSFKFTFQVSFPFDSTDLPVGRVYVLQGAAGYDPDLDTNIGFSLFFFEGDWYMECMGTTEVKTITFDAGTTYTGTLEVSTSSAKFTILGSNVIKTLADLADRPPFPIRMAIFGNTYPIMTLETVDEPELDVMISDSGVLSDGPAGAVVTAGLPVVDTGVLSDGTTPERHVIEQGTSTGVLADMTGPFALTDTLDSTGVLASGTSTQMNSSQMARDAGVLSDATPIVLATMASSTGVLSDGPIDANEKMAASTGVLSDRALDINSTSVMATDSGILSDGPIHDIGGDVAASTGVLAGVALPQIAAQGMATSTGVLSDGAIMGVQAQGMAESSGELSSAALTQLAAQQMAVDTGVLADQPLYDALFAAWVMNTQTTAMSRYNARLPYQSAAVIQGRLIGLGPSGFFEVAGEDDDGQSIDAFARTGRLQMGSQFVKYIGDMNVNYQSASPLEVGVTVYGGKHNGTWKFKTQRVKANEPTSSRAKTGQGFVSMYYEFSFANTGGAPASLFNATIPVAPSDTRKVI